MKKTMLLLMGVFFTLASQAQFLDVINQSPCTLKVWPSGVYPLSGLYVAASPTVLPPFMASPITMGPWLTTTGPSVPPKPPVPHAYTRGWDWYYLYVTPPTFNPAYGEQGGMVGDQNVYPAGAPVPLVTTWLNSSCPATINMQWWPAGTNPLYVNVTVVIQ